MGKNFDIRMFLPDGFDFFRCEFLMYDAGSVPGDDFFIRFFLQILGHVPVWDEDHFDFSKSAVAAGGSPVIGWDFRDLGEDNLTDALPHSTTLHSVYPNPFNPSTVLSYSLHDASFVNLTVYDCSGRKVEELIDGWRDAGSHELTFDASNLASGIYFYRLETGDFSAVRKMILMNFIGAYIQFP